MAVVAYALHDVARHLRVEESQRQAHQLHQEIRDEGDVDAGVHVERHPAAYEAHDKLCHEQPQLCQQHQCNETKVPFADALVHHRLCQERRYELQHHAHEHAQYQL